MQFATFRKGERERFFLLYRLHLRGPCLAPLPIFFLAERGRRLLLLRGQGGRQGRGVWYRGGAAALAGFVLAAPTRAVRSFPTTPTPRKCFAPRRRSQPAPLHRRRGGVRGGIECAPGGEVFCASTRLWLFDALSPVRSGAVRRPEEGVAAARGGEADGAPRAPGVGGMGDVECSARPAMSYKAGFIGP